MCVLFVGCNKFNPSLTNTAAIDLAETTKDPPVQSCYLLSITAVGQDLESGFLLVCIVDRAPVAFGWMVRS
jgi:hypothetical protein